MNWRWCVRSCDRDINEKAPDALRSCSELSVSESGVRAALLVGYTLQACLCHCDECSE